MSLNAAALKLMADKGLSLHDAAEIAAAMEADEPKRDTAADRRRAWDRERKRGQREAKRASGGMSGGNPPDPAPNEIDILTPTREKNSETEVSSQKPWTLPAGVSLQVWTDFLANRKRKRLGQTPTAWKAFCDDLARVSLQTGIPPPELIRQCTAKGWGAIYDPREQRDQRHERSNNPTGDAVGNVLRRLGTSG